VWPQAALQKVETLDLPVAVEFLLNRTGKITAAPGLG
jgi:hypothetical protein